MKEGWTYKKLGEVGTFSRGINFLKSNFVENGFPCIHYGQIHTKLGTKTYKHLTSIPENLVKKDKLASKGDIILAITSEDVEASCKSTAWLGEYDIAVGAHAAIYKHTLNPVFVSYFIQSENFQEQKKQYVHGFKVMEIKPSDIAKITIGFPSLDEQRAIVARLDSAFAQIDSLKANAEKQLSEARKLFQKALEEAMTPKDGWEEKTLGEVCRIERGGSPRPIKKYITEEENGLNWIKIGDTDPLGKYIYETKEKIKPEGLKKSRWVEVDDFLLSNSMSFGRPYILKTNGCIHDGWLVMRDYQQNLNIDFFYYLLISQNIQSQFRQKAQGSTVSNLNTNRVATVNICFPPLSTQHSIVAHLDSLSSHVRALEEKLKKMKDECDALKQAMLREVFE